jgi:dienelactone hydrolase
MFTLNTALAAAQSPVFNQKSSTKEFGAAAAGSRLPVASGTLGRPAKWTGFISRNSMIADTSIFRNNLLVGISRGTRHVRTPLVSPVAAIPPDYTIEPADTDGHPAQDGVQPDCPGAGIGCDNPIDPQQWADSAPNHPHTFYLPPSKTTGKLLVLFNGGDGRANPHYPIYGVAAGQGYHVIGLTYFTQGSDAAINRCDNDPERLSCYEDFMREIIYGTYNCTRETCRGLNISEHPQDSVLNRLVQALKWARSNYPSDGWGRYLTTAGEVDWSQVNVAGFSNGSGYAALMGTLFPSIGRVALLAGPNDGKGSSAENWVSADYIRRTEGITDTHYYGLVHELNKADGDVSTLYRITKAWHAFGMEGPFSPPRMMFDPRPGTTPDFLGAHMLISTDKGTIAEEAHLSVINDEYKNCDGVDPDECTVGEGIGYEPAWRCILGTGDASVSTPPIADAGPSQIVECQGAGGAIVTLDGSRSIDADCDVLTYTWTGPFGVASGRKPIVFLPLGTSEVTLRVSDGWWSSAPVTTLITVIDTQPPSLQVTLTPTSLWPADHRMVRVDAVISAADACDTAPPQVELTSITSDQPDNGTGDGDRAGDIQEADFGTFDRSFLLRAERAGSDPRGRTYTVIYTATDARGNRTQTSATVRVPHSR